MAWAGLRASRRALGPQGRWPAGWGCCGLPTAGAPYEPGCSARGLLQARPRLPRCSERVLTQWEAWKVDARGDDGRWLLPRVRWSSGNHHRRVRLLHHARLVRVRVAWLGSVLDGVGDGVVVRVRAGVGVGVGVRIGVRAR